jgi:hypothetical protein
MLAHIGREEMHDYIAIIHNKPALARLPFQATFFLVIPFGGLQHTFCQGVEHTVAGAVADNEIIGKRSDIFDVKEQDVLALFVLQGFDDFMC